MTNLTEQLQSWSTGPLPDPSLEQAAWRLFAVAHPADQWADNLWRETRDAYRAEVIKLALLPWTIHAAASMLAYQSEKLTFGTQAIGPALRAEVESYAESYLEDLWAVVGQPAQSIGAQARNAADLRMAARRVS